MTPTLVAAKHVAERVPLLFPFTSEMDPSVIIESATRTCRAKHGSDPAPENMLSGALIVDAVKGLAVQYIAAGLAQCRYVIVCTATLSDGQVLVRGIELPVVDY